MKWDISYIGSVLFTVLRGEYGEGIHSFYRDFPPHPQKLKLAKKGKLKFLRPLPFQGRGNF
jgi:hypothetical protein